MKGVAVLRAWLAVVAAAQRVTAASEAAQLEEEVPAGRVEEAQQVRRIRPCAPGNQGVVPGRRSERQGSELGKVRPEWGECGFETGRSGLKRGRKGAGAPQAL